MKWIYFGIPHMGGTYTVYRHLRDGLQPYGIDIRWAGLGRHAYEVAFDRQWLHEHANGAVVGADCLSEMELAGSFRDHIVEEEYVGLFVNVLADRVQTNIVRYLPANIRRVMIVHTITPATYAAARAVRDYVHVTVGVSPRIKNDLISRFGFDPERTFCVPNGVDLEPFQKTARSSSSDSDPLRLVFLGRVEDTAKGVLWLPKILSHLDGCDWRLTVAGDGPDLQKLIERCRPFGDRVVFVGKISSSVVPELLSCQDVMLFPSRFEGLPLTLVETQAAGCVPVASRIQGVTDFVVKDGVNGLLFPVGDCCEAATHVRRLASDRHLLKRMSIQAQKDALVKFSLSDMAKGYSYVLESTSKYDLPRKPLPLNEWTMPRGLKPGLRTALPMPLKNLLRVLRERARA